MRCPRCAVEINESWRPLYHVHPNDKSHDVPQTYLTDAALEEPTGDSEESSEVEIYFAWMYCPSRECGRLIVKGTSKIRTYTLGIPEFEKGDEWTILPRRATRHIDPMVPEKYANDYRQATAILHDSPKASAAMSRSVLADLLMERGGYEQFNLSSRIDDFINDLANPRPLRDNLHYLREIANFGVHTQKDVAGVFIEVTPEEAEFCLDILDSLFDHYIVGPEHQKQIRLAVDEKIDQAGRKPIKPLPEDEKAT